MEQHILKLNQLVKTVLRSSINKNTNNVLSSMLSLMHRPMSIETSYDELKEFVQRDVTGAADPNHVIFWVDDFSAQSVLTELGANYFTNQPFDQKIPFVKNVSVDEVADGDDAIDIGVTFTGQSHTPKRFSAFVNMSNLLQIQTKNEMENFLHRNISKAIAAKVEGKLLAKVLADTNVNTVGDGLSHDKLNAMEAAVNQVNDVQSSMGYICNPAQKGLLKKIEATGGALLWNNGRLNDEKILSSKSMAAKGLLYGDFSQMFILQFDKIQLIRDIYTLAKSGQAVLIVNGWYSYDYTDPKSFSKIVDITA